MLHSWPSALTSLVDVEIVEQHELPGQGVQIRRHVLAEDGTAADRRFPP